MNKFELFDCLILFTVLFYIVADAYVEMFIAVLCMQFIILSDKNLNLLEVMCNYVIVFLVLLLFYWFT